MEKTKELYVLFQLTKCLSTTINFDLHGCLKECCAHDILALVINFLNVD
jgi:hypothetical protein